MVNPPVPSCTRPITSIRTWSNRMPWAFSQWTASLRSLLYAVETAHPLLYPDNLQIQSHATMPDAAPGILDFQLDISGFKMEPQS